MKRRPYNQLKYYRWKGVNQQGKLVAGKMLALNDAEVRERLKQQSVQIKSLKRRSISLVTRLLHKVTKKDITLVTRQISTMIATGIPIAQALKLIEQSHQKAEMKSILRQIINGVESGESLSKSLRSSSHLFDSLYVDLVASSEQSGSLDITFKRIADYREKSEQLNAKVIKALIYPTMVVFTALAVCYLMLTMVIPQFESMFNGFGAQLPWFTLQVLTLSGFAQAYAGISFIVAVCLFIIIKLIKARSYQARLFSSRIVLKTPVIGNVITKASIAKFSRTLATSSHAGVPILTGLKAAARTTPNLHYRAAIEMALLDITTGMPLYIAMRNSDAFPDMVPQMVMIGEEAGRLDEMLNRIADIYEREIDNTVENLGKIIEPVIIIFLGTVIGGLVIAMYLPIFNLMSVLG